ncbi:MAG: hypothetical protein A2Z32_07190 [Chloroflexi bacterium RBG_16_69_14]|nr:MAG: hypothetical protein A2Z32_07190 [Chloroflexi bacterium RBG_16_69_14]
MTDPVDPSSPIEPNPLKPIPTPVAAEPLAPEPLAPEPAPVPSPSVASTRRLLGASFDLVTRASDDMRRASFYIGIVVLATVGPFALASLDLGVVSVHKTSRELEDLVETGFGAWYGLLGGLAVIGLVVAAVESRTMASAILGGHFARSPVTIREALARSRMVFWRAVIASIIVGIPVYVAQTMVGAGLEEMFGAQTDISLVTSAIVAAVVGAPLAYLLTGIVLGDVDPFEATRRSFRVFRARKAAAALVAVFETVAILLVVLGLSAGLDIALRVFDALGLGSDSGPAGLTLITIGVVVGVFALGTLIYTALAISVAPQVVMFVGLTHATIGLDHVRPGGDRDPTGQRARGGRFRWLTLPMRIGSICGVIGLVAGVAILAD